MKRIGGDNGLYEEETFENYIVLGPSERAIVDVYFPSAGDFQWEHEAEGKYTMATLHVTENEVSRDYSQRFSVLAAHTSVKKEIAAFLQQKILQEEKLSFTVDMGMNGMQHGGMMHMPCHTMPDGTQMGECASTSSSELKGIEWEDAMSMMNSVSTKDSVKWKIIDDSTKKVNQDIHWSFMQSAPVKITLYNDPTSPHPMQHPFHIHGNRFLVLSRDGKEEVNRVWKDTVLVKSGERVELLLDTSNPGKWMMHCHISEHLEDGMFGYFDVQPRP